MTALLRPEDYKQKKPGRLGEVFPPGLRLLMVAMTLQTAVSKAADPQPYGVELDKTDSTQLDRMLQDASTLISLQKTAAVGPFALIARAKQDQERFISALQSRGYYQGKALVRITGHTLDDPDLFESLNDAPADPPAQVTVSFELGPQYYWGEINLQGEAPQPVRDALKLKTGDKAIADDALAARDRLLKALLEQGYALAKVDDPIASLSAESRTVDLVYQVNSGPKVKLGRISIQGLEHIDESFVRRRLRIAEGQDYKASAIEAARKDLAGLGIFSSVRVAAGKQLDQQGGLPLSLIFSEKPRRSANAGAAYSTDIGGSLSAAWTHRNLFGDAEQLNLTAAITQLGGNSTTGIGYKAGATFNKPDFMERDQSLQIGLDAIKQSLIAYDEKALLAHMILNRKLAEHWQGGYGIAAEQAQISQEYILRDYTLFSLPITLKYDGSNSPLDPTKGIIANASLTPTQFFAGGASKQFVLMQASASTYLDMGEPGRSVLALRGLVGASGGASQFELPPDKRLYAGGSATVRGYKFQSIGPEFADGKPQGGTAIAAGSVELRQRLFDNYGFVLFADAGQVSANALPFTNSWQIGAGIGGRYYTSFGPIRVDVALPVNPQPGSGSFEVYVGLGQAF
ncbi:MAG: BamA/TamA family outer membrane protein [Methylomonas sp.]|jgi:translocation and assembly module TamA